MRFSFHFPNKLKFSKLYNGQRQFRIKIHHDNEIKIIPDPRRQITISTSLIVIHLPDASLHSCFLAGAQGPSGLQPRLWILVCSAKISPHNHYPPLVMNEPILSQVSQIFVSVPWSYTFRARSRHDLCWFANTCNMRITGHIKRTCNTFLPSPPQFFL